MLFTTEGPLGESAIVPKNFLFSLAQRIIVLRPKTSKLNPKFLKFLLDSQIIKKRYEALATGTTLGGIASKWFTKLLLVFPSSISEQKQIASILSNIQDQISQQQSHLSNLKTMRKSILNSKLTKEETIVAN